MTNKKASWLKHPEFLIGDVFCLLIAYLTAHFLEVGRFTLFDDIRCWQMIVAMIIASIITGILFESYQRILRRGYYKELQAVLWHLASTATMLSLYMFLLTSFEYHHRDIYIRSFIFAFILIYLSRIIWKQIIQQRVSNDPYRAEVLIITNQSFAAEFIEDSLSKEYADYKIRGCVLCDQDVDRETVKEIHNVPIIYSLSQALRYVNVNVVDGVLIQLDSVGQDIKAAIREFTSMGIAVHIDLSRMLDTAPEMRVEQFEDCKVLTVSIHKTQIRQLFIKRIIDIFCGAIGLLFVGIAFVILAPIIKLQSSGPVFFSQNRVGKNCRIFKIYKFRSMYIDAEARKQELMKNNKIKGPMFKMEDDPRITPIGRFIRRYSIDELPQFWNVLKGDMSMVGTRPPTVDEFEKYDKQHRIRLSIKPGITGLWQVSGRSNIVDFEEVVEFDEKYIKEWDLGVDCKIILKTILVVLRKKGSI